MRGRPLEEEEGAGLQIENRKSKSAAAVFPLGGRRGGSSSVCRERDVV